VDDRGAVSDNVTLNSALADYYAQRQGRYSDSTWRAHEGQLEKMRAWVTRDTQPNVWLVDVDERIMVRYFNRLRPPAYSPSTFNNYRQYVRQFFAYCVGEGWMRTNPMRHVDPMRVPKRIRLQLSADELLRMIDDCENPRDRVALAIGMNTGLRGGDIAALTVGAVNLGNNTLLAWQEKPDEETLLPVTAELRVELLRWFPIYAQAMALDDWMDLPNHWTLCPPAGGRAVDVTDLSKGFRVVYRPERRYTHPETIVQRALERLGHPTRQEGFHTLRRSAGREIYDLAVAERVGDPIRIAQALLGHKNQKTTELYLGITHERTQRDELMRGKSFLTRVRDAAVADAPASLEGQQRRHA
jgi:integrase